MAGGRAPSLIRKLIPLISYKSVNWKAAFSPAGLSLPEPLASVLPLLPAAAESPPRPRDRRRLGSDRSDDARELVDPEALACLELFSLSATASGNTKIDLVPMRYCISQYRIAYHLYPKNHPLRYPQTLQPASPHGHHPCSTSRHLRNHGTLSGC